MCYKFSVCVCSPSCPALKIMRRTISWSVACSAVPYFFTLSHKRHDFRENFTEYKMHILICSKTFFLKHFSLKEELSERLYVNVRRSSYKIAYLWLLSGFNATWFFLQIFEIVTNIKYHENPTGGSRVVACGRTGGRTDRDTHDEANSRFSQFCESA